VAIVAVVPLVVPLLGRTDNHLDPARQLA
jgi:hypothetical protein